MKDNQWHGMTYLLSFVDDSLNLFLMPLMPDKEQLKKRDHYWFLEETKKKVFLLKKTTSTWSKNLSPLVSWCTSPCPTGFWQPSLSLADPLKSVF